MDYDAIEFARSGCRRAPGLVLVITGIIAHKSSPRIQRYLIVGILGCFIYAMFTGGSCDVCSRRHTSPSYRKAGPWTSGE